MGTIRFTTGRAKIYPEDVFKFGPGRSVGTEGSKEGEYIIWYK